MRNLAPVVVFAYRRTDHLRNTLASLMRCEGFDQSPVIVYCDGPRDDSEVASVIATRELARTLLGEHAEYHFSEINQGLSRSVIAGVSETVGRFGRAIVVEDDLVPRQRGIGCFELQVYGQRVDLAHRKQALELKGALRRHGQRPLK